MFLAIALRQKSDYDCIAAPKSIRPSIPSNSTSQLSADVAASLGLPSGARYSGTSATSGGFRMAMYTALADSSPSSGDMYNSTVYWATPVPATHAMLAAGLA